MLPQKYHHHEPLGKQVRFSHEECGDTRSRLYVRRTERGYIYHCHNCAPACSGFVRTNCVLSPNETLNYLNSSGGHSDSVEDPLKDWEFCEIPDYGKEWLKKYALHPSWFNTTSTESRGIFICGARRGSNSVQLCFTSTKREDKWAVLRRDDTDGGRYQQIGTPPSLVFPTTVMESKQMCNKNNDSCIVVVEDIISAIKVNEHCQCAALLGSNISPETFTELLQFGKVIIWLDYDKYKESQRYAYRGRLFGLDCTALITEKDPKDYSDKEILCHLKMAIK